MSAAVTIEPTGEQTAAQAIRDAINAAVALKQIVALKMRNVDLTVTPDDTLESVSGRFAESLPATGRR